MVQNGNAPTAREIRVFGSLWLVFFVAVGALAAWKPEGLLGAATLLGPAWLIGWIFGGGNRAARAAGIGLPLMFALTGGGARWWGWSFQAILGTAAAVGLGGAVLVWAAPRLGRALYAGWMEAAAPIGWTISRLVLGAVYYLVLTPIGLSMRLAGRDPMHRRADRSATTYWHRRRETPDARSYFRQF